MGARRRPRMTTITGVFDCDTHIYEPHDAATRYLPKEYADRSIRTMKNASGEDVVLAGSRIATFNSEGGMGFDLAYQPGSLRQMLKDMASGDPNARYSPEPMRDEFVQREPRLALHDTEDVARCVLFPGVIALSAEHYVQDTDALYANLSSYNRWSTRPGGSIFRNASTQPPCFRCPISTRRIRSRTRSMTP